MCQFNIISQIYLAFGADLQNRKIEIWLYFDSQTLHFFSTSQIKLNSSHDNCSNNQQLLLIRDFKQFQSRLRISISFMDRIEKAMKSIFVKVGEISIVLIPFGFFEVPVLVSWIALAVAVGAFAVTFGKLVCTAGDLCTALDAFAGAVTARLICVFDMLCKSFVFAQTDDDDIVSKKILMTWLNNW